MNKKIEKWMEIDSLSPLGNTAPADACDRHEMLYGFMKEKVESSPEKYKTTRRNGWVTLWEKREIYVLEGKLEIPHTVDLSRFERQPCKINFLPRNNPKEGEVILFHIDHCDGWGSQGWCEINGGRYKWCLSHFTGYDEENPPEEDWSLSIIDEDANGRGTFDNVVTFRFDWKDWRQQNETEVFSAVYGLPTIEVNQRLVLASDNKTFVN